MALPEDFVDPITTCLAPTVTFPPLAGPGGLPNFLLASLDSNFAGINFVLDAFDDLPDLPSQPTVEIFLDAFYGGNFSFPFAVPSITILGFPTPTLAGPAPPIPAPTLPTLALIELFIRLPFEVFEIIIQKLIDDQVIEIPSIATIELIFNDLAWSLGIDTPSIGILGG